MRAIGLKIKQSLANIYPESEIKGFIQMIITEVLGLSMTDYYMGKDIKLSAIQVRDLEEIINRLQKQEPIQYILGQGKFFGRNFDVAPGVLIPRPETEELVSLIIDENNHRPIQILDIGTGSGCIAITLAKELAQSEVTAWDVSTDALTIARRNNEKLEASVCIEQKDVLTVTNHNKQFDIIVSNPPYVMESEKEEMEENVLQWEPSLALFVSNQDPLLFYRTIAELGTKTLTPNGKIYFEINQAFGQETKELLDNLGYKGARIIKDFFGKDRIVTATR